MMTGVTVREASAEILSGARPLPPVRVALRDALGLVLASDVTAPVALPPWDNASMDGYAVRAADIAGATTETPVVLEVLETVAAGGRASRAVGPGEAIRIMTGAPVPDGTDTVVRVEDTDAGTERVAVRSERDARRNVRPRGEDLAAGAVAVAAGTRIGAAQLGVLASVGAAHVDVHRRPRVAILSTGDELVDVGEFAGVVAGRRIVASNSYTLWALVRESGGEPLDLGIAKDDPVVIGARLEEGAMAADVVVTSGGVSVGAFDFTRDVVASLGADLRLWRVRMRPGAPIGFGTLGGIQWLGLPGNPVSAMVTFELFARPLLRRLSGEPYPFRLPVPVRLAETVTLAAPLTHFLRAVVSRADRDGEPPTAHLTGAQGSGLLTSMARANALVIVPDSRPRVEAGELLFALMLGGGGQPAAELGI